MWEIRCIVWFRMPSIKLVFPWAFQRLLLPSFPRSKSPFPSGIFAPFAWCILDFLVSLWSLFCFVWLLPIFPYCGMEKSSPISLLKGGSSKGTPYPLICLSFAWKNLPWWLMILWLKDPRSLSRFRVKVCP